MQIIKVTNIAIVHTTNVGFYPKSKTELGKYIFGNLCRY